MWQLYSFLICQFFTIILMFWQSSRTALDTDVTNLYIMIHLKSNVTSQVVKILSLLDI
jgi:hypothetical protein